MVAAGVFMILLDYGFMTDFRQAIAFYRLVMVGVRLTATVTGVTFGITTFRDLSIILNRCLPAMGQLSRAIREEFRE